MVRMPVLPPPSDCLQLYLLHSIQARYSRFPHRALSQIPRVRVYSQVTRVRHAPAAVRAVQEAIEGRGEGGSGDAGTAGFLVVIVARMYLREK